MDSASGMRVHRLRHIIVAVGFGHSPRIVLRYSIEMKFLVTTYLSDA